MNRTGKGHDHPDPSENGGFRRKVRDAVSLLSPCELCPRKCGVDRLKGEKGMCLSGRYAVVSSYGPHMGEERPLSGTRGSGTIFFSGCNLKCVFCQNYDISQRPAGREFSPEQLSDTMMKIMDMGCHNLNLVSPTHVVPQILEALELASGMGFDLPVVYNTGGFDLPDTLEVLEGVVDIYMPDMKYSDGGVSRRLSGVSDYPEVNRRAVLEMHRQVGDLVLDENGIAVRGLLVRHLVLPGGLSGTCDVMEFLAEEVSRDTYVNIMDQYRPEYMAFRYPGIDRRISRTEFEDAVRTARDLGLHRFAE